MSRFFRAGYLQQIAPRPWQKTVWPVTREVVALVGLTSVGVFVSGIALVALGKVDPEHLKNTKKNTKSRESIKLMDYMLKHPLSNLGFLMYAGWALRKRRRGALASLWSAPLPWQQLRTAAALTSAGYLGARALELAFGKSRDYGELKYAMDLDQVRRFTDNCIFGGMFFGILVPRLMILGGPIVPLRAAAILGICVLNASSDVVRLTAEMAAILALRCHPVGVAAVVATSMGLDKLQDSFWSFKSTNVENPLAKLERTRVFQEHLTQMPSPHLEFGELSADDLWTQMKSCSKLVSELDEAVIVRVPDEVQDKYLRTIKQELYEALGSPKTSQQVDEIASLIKKNEQLK